MTFTKKELVEILETALVIVVAVSMFFYGIGKPFQFTNETIQQLSVSELTSMELMWAFYGYSKSYAMTLGLFEILGGTLILIKRTRIIGCLFTLTILVNVILQDIFFKVHFGALKAAILYLLLILTILWLNKDNIIQSVKALLIFNTSEEPKYKSIIKLIIAFICFVLFRIIEYYLTIKW